MSEHKPTLISIEIGPADTWRVKMFRGKTQVQQATLNGMTSVSHSSQVVALLSTWMKEQLVKDKDSRQLELF